MSTSEILDALPRLTVDEKNLIREKLDELEAQSFEESEEHLAAIDAGSKSAEKDPEYTPESVRAELSKWTTESS